MVAWRGCKKAALSAGGMAAYWVLWRVGWRVAQWVLDWAGHWVPSLAVRKVYLLVVSTVESRAAYLVGKLGL